MLGILKEIEILEFH